MLLFLLWFKDFWMADINTKVNLEMQAVLSNADTHGEIHFCN